MSSLAWIVLGEKARRVAKEALATECKTFTENPSLLNSPYFVKASVPFDVLDTFLSFVEGHNVPITSQNISGLWQLSDEFGFGRFLSRLSSLGQSQCSDFVDRQDEQVRDHERRLSALESSFRDRESLFARLDEFLRFESEFRAFATEIRDELERQHCSVRSSLSELEVKLRSGIDSISELKSRPEAVSSSAHEGERVQPAFNNGADGAFFKVAVVGPRADSDRRRKLIVLAEQFESFIDFEFLNVDEGPEPEGTSAALFCGVPPPSDWKAKVVRVCFRGDADRDADVEIDVRTGEGIGLALAAAVTRAKGSEDFTFCERGRSLVVTNAPFLGVKVFGRPEAATVERIVVEADVKCIEGFWSPLFPTLREIEFRWCSTHESDSGWSFKRRGGARCKLCCF
jgi:hypothetical protein